MELPLGALLNLLSVLASGWSSAGSLRGVSAFQRQDRARWKWYAQGALAAGIDVSGALFAIAHKYNTVGIATLFASRVIWGAIAWKAREIEATGALHIANNYLAFYMAGFGLQAQTSQLAMADCLFALAGNVVYAAAVLLLGRRFGWFGSTRDGTAAFNDRKCTEMEAGNQRCLAKQGAQPEAGDVEAAQRLLAGWEKAAAPNGIPREPQGRFASCFEAGIARLKA